MFTLKHVTDTAEVLYEGTEVNFSGRHNTVWYTLPDREIRSIEGTGVVYVMNQNGRTVATYDLNVTVAALPPRFSSPLRDQPTAA